MGAFGSRSGGVVGAVRAVPRSSVVLAALTLVVFGMVGLVSCRLGGSGAAATAGPGAAGAGLPMTLPATEPEIRVRVRAGASLVTIGAPSPVTVRWEGSLAGSRVMAAPVEATVEAGAVVLRGPGAARWTHRPGEAVTIAAPAAGSLTLDGHAYPGSLVLVPREGAGQALVDVIAQMGIESYLPGVVAKELYRTWPLPTFQAQAVCARSYALHERGRARAAGRLYDVEATTQDQVFAGATDLPVAHSAVESTRGQVITYRGGVLRAYYSSTSGGRAASAADTWPTGPGFEFNQAFPLQAAPRQYFDQASPAYRWTRDLGLERLSLRMRRWGQENGHPVKQIGMLASVEVEESNLVGRPVRYRVKDTAERSFSMKAEELRVACNWPVPGVPDVTPDERVRSGDLTLRVVGTRAMIDGRGFGHGVGMCQYSAAEMAKRGMGWREIVLHFYPGAGIERGWR